MTPNGTQSNDPPVLRIKDLCAGYGTKSVLRDVSFEVQPGEIISLLGINGAGKSTCFKTIAGQLKPQRGEITLQGADIGSRGVAHNVHAGLVLVPEGARSFPDLSVRENLELCRFVVRDAKAFRERLDDVMATFPRLRERIGEKAGTLSGGERQMLALGRAIILRPKVLLLDEPFLGLAPIIINEVVRQLASLRDKIRCGIVLAEQNVAATLRVADRTLLLRSGVIEALNDDTPPEDVQRLLLSA